MRYVRDDAYNNRVPKVWATTIEEHRAAVREAIFDAVWDLINERGPLSLTMSEIAARAHIGRATLYKYFADVEAILLAAHNAEVGSHLQQVHELATDGMPPHRRLEAVLLHHATVVQRRETQSYDALRALLHTDPGLHAARDELRAVLTELISSSMAAGEVRDDMDAAFLADYCLFALGAGSHSTDAAVPQALVRLICDSLRGTRQT